MKVFIPPIPLTLRNAQRLEDALRRANGRAQSYKVTTFNELRRLAEIADLAIDRVLPDPGTRLGVRATVRADSTLPERDTHDGRVTGHVLSKPRRVTTVGFTWVHGGWALAEIRRADVRIRREVQCDLVLTEAQEDIAVAAIRSLFRVRAYSEAEVLAVDQYAQFLPMHRLTAEVEGWLNTHAASWTKVRASHPAHGICWGILFHDRPAAFHFTMRWREPTRAAA